MARLRVIYNVREAISAHQAESGEDHYTYIYYYAFSSALEEVIEELGEWQQRMNVFLSDCPFLLVSLLTIKTCYTTTYLFLSFRTLGHFDQAARWHYICVLR
jgi:hypothetical protein